MKLSSASVLWLAAVLFLTPQVVATGHYFSTERAEKHAIPVVWVDFEVAAQRCGRAVRRARKRGVRVALKALPPGTRSCARCGALERRKGFVLDAAAGGSRRTLRSH